MDHMQTQLQVRVTEFCPLSCVLIKLFQTVYRAMILGLKSGNVISQMPTDFVKL